MIAGIVLAAGRSRRMGRPKALLPFQGGTLLSHAVAALRGGGCGEVIVVCGPAHDETAAAAIARGAERLGARVAVNPADGSEQIDSLRAGILALSAESEAAMVLPVDVPGVDAAAVRSLAEAFLARGAPVVRAAHGVRHGHPVLFSRALFPELLQPSLPEGARTVIHRHADASETVDLPASAILDDVDTPDDYRRLMGDAPAPGEPLDAAGAARLAHDALEGGEPVASVVVVEAADESRMGERIAVFADRVLGTLRDAELDGEAVRLARLVLAGDLDAGVRSLADGSVSVFVEAHRGQAELVIVGAGHIARPLCSVGALLGFRVTVLDDRPDFATRERFPQAARVLRADFSAPLAGVAIGRGTWLVLATRGHKYDFEALRDALRRPEPPAYVGMVASRRRTRAALEQLIADGVPAERLRAVHAPIGLDVGAETPEEIAVAIAAELVRVRRGGTGQPLAHRARVVERTLGRVECAPHPGTSPASPHPKPTPP
jgi:xanthine dehydrogenase accessory factor